VAVGRARHGLGALLDIPFAFDNLDGDGVLDVTGPAPPQHLADAVHGAWVAFVTSGDPGWDTYDTGRRPAMVFDETPKMVEDPWQLARTAWSPAAAAPAAAPPPVPRT